MTEVLSVGRYMNHIVSTEQGRRFTERLRIFDNDLIVNSRIAPI